MQDSHAAGIDHGGGSATKRRPVRSKHQRPPISRWRKRVQYGFLALLVLIAAQFTYWVLALAQGRDPLLPRPPGVEGFLPISALISLKYWLLSGTFNRVHPASLVLFLIILATALFLKKGFCSWVCPVGLFSEWLDKLHIRLFKRRMVYHPGWDYPLRSIKYLLLLFFVWAIIVGMDQGELRNFIYSPYNEVADIKMGLFFAPPSFMASIVLLCLVVLSVLIPYFWCRFLCPYGALLGFISIFSPLSVKRNTRSCIDCKLCTRACPAALSVHKLSEVSSDECHACLACVEACPVPDTLELALSARRDAEGHNLPQRVVKWKTYALSIVLLFVLGTSLARVFGVWQNDLTNAEYREHLQHIDDPIYTHTGGMAGPPRE